MQLAHACTWSHTSSRVCTHTPLLRRTQIHAGNGEYGQRGSSFLSREGVRAGHGSVPQASELCFLKFGLCAPDCASQGRKGRPGFCPHFLARTFTCPLSCVTAHRHLVCRGHLQPKDFLLTWLAGQRGRSHVLQAPHPHPLCTTLAIRAFLLL